MKIAFGSGDVVHNVIVGDAALLIKLLAQGFSFAELLSDDVAVEPGWERLSAQRFAPSLARIKQDAQGALDSLTQREATFGGIRLALDEAHFARLYSLREVLDYPIQLASADLADGFELATIGDVEKLVLAVLVTAEKHRSSITAARLAVQHATTAAEVTAAVAQASA